MIFNQSNDLSHDYYFQRFLLSTNVHVELKIEKSFINKLKSPYSACEVNSNSDLVNSKFANNLLKYTKQKAYSKAFCEELSKFLLILKLNLILFKIN